MDNQYWEIDEEVIHVDNKPSFCDHIAEIVVHELLKGSRRVGEAKKHHGWFKKSFMGDESSFPLVSILDVDIVISPANIKLGKDLYSLEFINKVGDKRKGVHIMDCVFIDIAIVLTGVETAILLFNKEGGCLQRV